MDCFKALLQSVNKIVEITTCEPVFYTVEGDTSVIAGILRFSHEWVINLSMDKDQNVKFLGGWEIACEDIDYGPQDEDWFEYLHPGVLADIKMIIRLYATEAIKQYTDIKMCP